jgi:cytochrome c553
MMSEPLKKAEKGFIARIGTAVSSVGARFSLATLVAAGGTVSVMLWLDHPRSAQSQPATITLGNGEDLRPLYANAEDVAEGKRLASASCAGCHGANGISTMASVPNLAGQRPAYLYLELKVYQSGGRGENPMNNAVKFLNNDALIKLAAYYASLDPAQPETASGARVAEADPVQSGKAAAAPCAGCHGEAGVTKTPGMPSLAGLDLKYLIAAMKAYKDGQRKNMVMAALLASVSEADMNNLALYYALQPPARAQTPSTGNQSAGRAAAAACAGCHGDQGVSSNPANPSLAGQDAQYLASALAAYKDGSREDAAMKGLAAALAEGTIKDVAAFYAAQQPQPPNVRKPLSTAEWAERCDRCHGTNGNSTDPRSPALAAQRADYLNKVLHSYRTGARRSPQMAAMSAVLSEEDVDNLSAYYARQHARAFVYVIVPPR